MRAARVSLPLLLLLAARLSLGTVYSLIVPIWEAYDEDGHFAYARYLARYRQLLQPGDPEAEEVWEKFQPPLYYILVATVIAGFDLGETRQLPELNPYFTAGFGGVNYALHPDTLDGAARQTALAVYVARLQGVALSTLSVVFVYRAARRIWPDRPNRVWAAALLYAFWPQFLFVGGMVTNDGLMTVLAAAALDSMVMLSQTGFRARPALILGLLLGGALLTKLTAFALLPVSLVALITSLTVGTRVQMVWRSWRPWVVFAVLGLLALGALWVLGSQDFIVQQVFQLHTAAEFLRLVRLGAIGEQPLGEFIDDVLRYGFRTFLASFGWGNLETYPWLYTVWGIAAAGACVGVGTALFRRIQPALLSMLVLQVVSQIALAVALAISQRNAFLVPGRYLLPALPAVCFLLVAGWSALLSRWPRLHVWKYGAAALVVLAWSIPVWTLAPAYAKPQPLTAAQAAAIPQRTEVNFGGEMQLLGYALETVSAQPGDSLRLTLYWETLIAMDRNWSTFVHITNQQGIIVTQQDRYPGGGLLATSFLPPGRTFADEYVIPIPEGAYAPDRVHVNVGLYDHIDGFRLPVSTGGDSFAFGELTIQPRPGYLPNMLQQNLGQVIELSGYDIDARVLHPGETLGVTLYWRALRETQANYSISVRVRDAQQNRWAVQDGWPQQGAAPTSTWPVGQTITDVYHLALDAATPPGQYLVEVLVYDSATLKPLRLFGTDGRPMEAAGVQLSHVRVLP